jgi:hypothetical protein
VRRVVVAPEVVDRLVAVAVGLSGDAGAAVELRLGSQCRQRCLHTVGTDDERGCVQVLFGVGDGVVRDDGEAVVAVGGPALLGRGDAHLPLSPVGHTGSSRGPTIAFDAHEWAGFKSAGRN